MATIQLPQFNGENFSNWTSMISVISEEKGVKDIVEHGVTQSSMESKRLDSKGRSIIIKCWRQTLGIYQRC